MASGYGFQISDWVVAGAVALGGYFIYKALIKPVSDVTEGAGGFIKEVFHDTNTIYDTTKETIHDVYEGSKDVVTTGAGFYGFGPNPMIKVIEKGTGVGLEQFHSVAKVTYGNPYDFTGKVFNVTKGKVMDFLEPSKKHYYGTFTGGNLPINPMYFNRAVAETIVDYSPKMSVAPSAKKNSRIHISSGPKNKYGGVFRGSYAGTIYG